MSSVPGQWGNGSLREQFLGNTPTDLVENLTQKNWHAKNFPRDSQDKTPYTGPYAPVSHGSTKSHQYELFMLSADFPVGNGIQEASRSQLLAGQTHTFRATFQPSLWEIYTFQFTGSTAGDLMYFDTGIQYPSPPCDVIVMIAGNGDLRRVPGRGDALSVFAPATNAGAIFAVVKAVSALNNDTVGSVTE